ncbi:MAG: TIGR00266 family protein [Clostridiales bacterium]|nr:TIGR00266 family protein [Clostridiales bacterium]
MRYEIKGESMPVVICNLQNGESLNCEAGAMSWMSPNMKMETSGGGAGKMLGRLFSGEAMFQNKYTAYGGEGMIAFASSMPGSILALQITPDHPVIVQKRGYLASESGVNLSVSFQKKGLSGFFGGEGFIMQKLSGNGTAFVEIDGSTVEYVLAQGQQIIVNTGNIAMMDATCSIDIQQVQGVKNVLFGGEGLFNTIITGPGKIVLQTMPLSSLSASISSALPNKG